MPTNLDLDVLDLVAKSIMENNKFQKSEKEKNISVWRSDTFESDEIFYRPRGSALGSPIEHSRHQYRHSLSDQSRYPGERKHWRPAHSLMLERQRAVRLNRHLKSQRGKEARAEAYAAKTNSSFPQLKAKKQHQVGSLSEDSDEYFSTKSQDRLRAGLMKMMGPSKSTERVDTLKLTSTSLTCCKPHFRSLSKRCGTHASRQEVSIVTGTFPRADSARFMSSWSGLDESFSTMDLGDSNSDSGVDEYSQDFSGKSGDLGLLARSVGNNRLSSTLKTRGKAPQDDTIDELISLAFGIIPAVVIKDEETYDLMVERLKRVAVDRSYSENTMKLALIRSLGISPCDGASLRLATSKAAVSCISHIGSAERDEPLIPVQEEKDLYYFDLSLPFDELVDDVARAHFEPCHERIKQLERSIMNPAVTFEMRTAVDEFWTKVHLYERLCRRWHHNFAFTESMLQQSLFRSLPLCIRDKLARMDGWSEATRANWYSCVHAAISQSTDLDSPIVPRMEAGWWSSLPNDKNNDNSIPKSILSGSGGNQLPFKLEENLRVASYSRMSDTAAGRRHHGQTSPHNKSSDSARDETRAAYMALVSHVAARALARRRQQQQQQDYQNEPRCCPRPPAKGSSKASSKRERKTPATSRPTQ